MPPEGSPISTYLVLLMTTFFWGGTAVAGKVAIRDIPPLTVGVLRYGVAAALLAVLFRGGLPALRSLGRDDLKILLGVGLLGACLNHVFYFLGLVFAPATHGALIPPTTSPVWTVLLGARLGQEPVTRRQVGGMFLCLVGVVLVIRPERLATGTGAGVLLGDLLFLLCGLAWGVYSYVAKLAMDRLPAVATLTWGMSLGTLFLMPMAMAERPWEALPAAQATAWGAVAYLTLGGTLLSFLGWSVAIRRLGASRTAVFTNLVPVFGVLLSWLVLGERLAALQMIGGALAVAGVGACQGPVPPSAAVAQR